MAEPVNDEVQLLANGENSLCLVFDEQAGWPIQLIAEHLKSELSGLIDIIPAYESITLVFADDAASLNEQTAHLKVLLRKDHFGEQQPGEQHVIPVCYAEELAPDLDAVCKHLKLTPEELIRVHTKTVYPVAMLGFQPGFIYLDSLPTKLHIPRKATPALDLAAGSVAIGGSQTGIYSLASPGGWWVIGRTPVVLFDHETQPPVQIKPGDSIRFEAISLSQYKALSNAD